MRSKLTTPRATRADAEKSLMTLDVGFVHDRARHRAASCIPIRAVPYDRLKHELRPHCGQSPIFMRRQFWNFL